MKKFTKKQILRKRVRELEREIYFLQVNKKWLEGNIDGLSEYNMWLQNALDEYVTRFGKLDIIK